MHYEPIDPIAETRRLYLDREPKPEGWEPATPEELQEFRERLRQAVESKQVPRYAENAERLVHGSNGRTEVPMDPAARRAWATDKARKQGWIETREE